MKERAEVFVEKLQEWSWQHKRVFPWRNTRDPYRTMVAELLLQRTKAEQVISVYSTFIQAWPDVSALAAARESQVMSVIRPLGLAYRAKRMINLAREIQQRFGSRIPNNLRSLESLYGLGIGDYVAHAILCFSYGQSISIVDKNVLRVLSRVFSIKTTPNSHRDREIWDFATSLVSLSNNAQEYNWTLLDLAALVCTTRNPRCLSCPVLPICDYGRLRTA